MPGIAATAGWMPSATASKAHKRQIKQAKAERHPRLRPARGGSVGEASRGLTIHLGGLGKEAEDIGVNLKAVAGDQTQGISG